MQKTLSYAALLLVSQFPQLALADTDVYLTNNSPEPLQIDIRQSGSGQLQPGSQWSQHRTELGPWRAPWYSASIAMRGSRRARAICSKPA